ncbi:hypothetical protein A3D62_03270 [Candidatus Kaiserbacteria bacterium RIFCSPHIGHO2_02_FULL_49_11]|uniref:Uncharacterized protein n=1 Tax=Candidatus Kaiserbacteria bacterium RIFCSPHIGHO2_02_FULL_49_11 TaxID=1798489 RepID=A0A1F6D068_9BACT|nr:MAG: hypothetical protein A3D62_03270 [Candidatus Kaiserbacteria bacterium RIFCSPHIGHO2_02_FULL_49_11]
MNKWGKIGIVVTAALLIVVGVWWQFFPSSTGPASQTQARAAAYQIPVNNTSCDMEYRRVRLLPGLRFPFHTGGCEIWFEVVDAPPKGVHIYVGRNEELVTGSGGYWRGMPLYNLPIKDGIMKMMPRVPDIVEIEYRLCPPGATPFFNGCRWKGWFFFGSEKPPVKLAS